MTRTRAQRYNQGLRAASLHFVLLSAVVDAVTVSAAPPSISFQPRNQAVMLYQQAAFGVIANGTAPLTYQWLKDSQPIVGATNDQIVLVQPQFADAGRYSVLVANAEGSVTSAETALTVNPPKAGDLDYSFAWGGSINGEIRSVAVQRDRKVLIGGLFTTVHGAVRRRIARLNADGTTDYTFTARLSQPFDNESVSSIAVQSDGKVLIGGYFNAVDGISRINIARLNADGSLDSTFQNGLAGADWPPFGGSVGSIAVQSDGKVLIGGLFSKVNGASRGNIARLNADGSLDNGFQNGLSGANAYVPSIAVQSDGKVLVAGPFTKVNGASCTGIARLNADGTLDDGFRVELSVADSAPLGDSLTEVRGSVRDVAVQSDGKVLIGGYFTKVNGQRRTNIARLNADGTLDTTFQDGVAAVADFSNGSVISLALQRDGKVVIGGYFTTVNDKFRGKVARLNADGTLDTGFLSGVTDARGAEYEYPSVNSVAIQSDGKVLIGGWFRAVNGIGRKGVARLNADGIVDNAFQNGMAEVSGVSSFAVQSDGKVVIGGAFTTVLGASRNSIARLNSDGTPDSGFLNGLSGANGAVRSVALQSDGKMIIGGNFTAVNGVSRTNIARLNPNGTLDMRFQPEIAGQSSIGRPIVVQSDGKVLLAGNFTNVNGAKRTGIARLNADGTLDAGFQDGLAGIVRTEDEGVSTIAVQRDGKVLVGGRFSTVNDERSYIARLNADGTLDSSFQNGFAGIVNTEGQGVSTIAVHSNGKVLIGGHLVSGQEVIISPILGVTPVLVWLNPDGTLDSGFKTEVHAGRGSNSAMVLSIVVQSDGKVLVGGHFSSVDGISRTGIARLNADGSLDSTFQNGFSGGSVSSIALQSDGKVLIGGFFTTVNGVPAVGIARLWGSADLPPRIRNVNRSETNVMLTWDALPNRNYRVQYKEALSSGNWTNLPGDISTNSGSASKTDTTAGNASQRFYQVVLLP